MNEENGLWGNLLYVLFFHCLARFIGKGHWKAESDMCARNGFEVNQSECLERRHEAFRQFIFPCTN